MNNKTTRKEMAEWVLQQFIEGLCSGTPLYRIAQNIVDGIANMIATNEKSQS